MALGFFRKRQKLIFGIMVVLMVSFLIGYQGFDMIFRKDSGKVVIARTKFGDIEQRRVASAAGDVQTLSRIFGYIQPRSMETFAFSVAQMTEEGEAGNPWAYLMLLEEAQADGVRVSEGEVTQWIAANQTEWDALAQAVRDREEIPESRLREVLARWLMVYKNFQLQVPSVPPSLRELAELYRAGNEQIKLQAVQIPAGLYLNDLPEPTEEEILAQFQAGRSTLADGGKPEEFPFGYLAPARADIAWLMIDVRALSDGTMPSQEQLLDYYNRNRGKYMAVADDGAKTQKTFSEARASIVETLKGEAAEARFGDLRNRIERMLTESEKSPAAEAYANAVAKVTLPADVILNQKIPVLVIEQMPLDEAISTLVAQAGGALSAVAFPFGTHGDITIDRNVKVTLKATDISVADALARICKQVPDLGELQWKQCAGLEGALFPVAPVAYFPVTTGQSGMLSKAQAGDVKLLAGASGPDPENSRRRVGLLDLVYKAVDEGGKELESLQGSAIAPFGTRTPETQGLLYWRVTGSAASAAPETMTDEIRKQVVEDLKRKAAFDKAVAAAEAIGTPKAMKAFAEKKTLDVIDTPMFSRATAAMMLSFATTLDLDEAEAAYLAEKAFAALTPADLDKAYPKAGDQAVAVPMKGNLSVYVAARTDYQPALESGFDIMRKDLVRKYSNVDSEQRVYGWFADPQVRERMEFEYVQGE